MSQPTKSLREAMPETTAFIDDLREAFGAAMINAAIKAGIDGRPTFYACENGHEIGTKQPTSGYFVNGRDLCLTPADKKGGVRERN